MEGSKLQKSRNSLDSSTLMALKISASKSSTSITAKSTKSLKEKTSENNLTLTMTSMSTNSQNIIRKRMPFEVEMKIRLWSTSGNREMNEIDRYIGY